MKMNYQLLKEVLVDLDLLDYKIEIILFSNKYNIINMFEQLKPGKSYLFIRKDKQYRANFIDIIGNTIRVNNYQFVKEPNTVICTPINWIIRIETLVDIMKNHDCILPDDILLIIDEFL